MHLAAGIWKDNKDMRVDKNVKISIQTVQGSKLQKSLRYGHWVIPRVIINTNYTCPRGEIGRHKGLKILAH